VSEGRRLGAYRLGRRIAVGGMAEIFEARRADGRGPPLVIKQLLPAQARDPEVVRMLEHEGRLMQTLSHDNLVRVLDVNVHEPEPFLVLERIDGASLADVLAAMRRDGARPSAEMALAVVLPLLDALAHVHRATDEDGAPLGVVHRDVTPHNVLLTRDGRVKLGDFGIARSSLRDGRTRTGVVKGKLRYLAPEQVTGSDIDARTDLYAVGTVLFELLAGEPYLDAPTDAQLLRLAEDPSFRPVDARFDKLLEKTLSRFPEARPRDAETLRARLAEAGAGLDVEAGRAAWAARVGAIAGAPPAAPPVASRSRSWLRAAPVVGLALLGIAGVGYLWLGNTETEGGGEPAPVATPPGAREARPAEATAPVEPAPVEPAPVAEPPSSEPPPDPEPSAAVAASPPPSRAAAASRAARASAPPRREPAPVPPDPGPDPELERARSEVAALRASLAERGILADDLSPAQRAGLRAVDAAIGSEDATSARSRLDAVAPGIRALRVDDAFVRAKLERVDRRIREARARGAETSEIERLSALALEDLLARHPEATNRRLNQILGRLP